MIENEELYSDIKQEIKKADAKLMFYVSLKFPELEGKSKKDFSPENWNRFISSLKKYMLT